MLEGAVVTAKFGVAGLLVLLGYRMTTQASLLATYATPAPHLDESDAPVAPRRNGRSSVSYRAGSANGSGSELITPLCILYSLQERDCREQGLDLSLAPANVRRYVLAWLYGAACELVQPAVRHTPELKNVVAQLASRKLGLGGMAGEQALETLTDCSVMLACFRHGIEGAAHWSRCRYVPGANSVYNALTTNAFL